MQYQIKHQMKNCLFFLIFLLVAVGCSIAPSNLQQENVTDTTSVLSEGLSKTDWGNKLDSMLHIAATAKQDTSLAQLHIDIGQLYADNDFQKAKDHYLTAGNLSERLDWNKGRYMYASGFSNMLYREGLIDSGIVIIRQAYDLAIKENNRYWIARTSMSTGNGYFYKTWFETTLKYYQEALHILEETGEDKETLLKLYDNSGVVYRILGLADKAIEYHKKALDSFGDEEPSLKGNVLYNLATAYHINSDAETEYYFREALRVSELHNNKLIMAAIYIGLSNLHPFTNLEEAEKYCRKGLDLTTEINNPNLGGLANLTLGVINIHKLNFKQAEQYILKSLEMAEQIGYTEYQVTAHRQLAILFGMKHDFLKSNLYSVKADSVERAIARVETLRSSEEMAAKYETEKKELKIASLEERQHYIILLSICAGAVLLLLLAALFFRWRWTVQKRQLAETQIVQLEKEKQLIASQALLDGETRERTRLARDLHDGLGSILVSTKLNLLEMKKGASLEYASLERFDNAIVLIDKSISEMRRVAHHLMPEALTTVGLKQSTADFVASIPHATFSWYGDVSRFDTKLEEAIYRIMHELVTNALKHSGAEQILVDFVRYDNHITLTVQDDGCGFDPDTASKGMGMSNIRTRIDAFNGHLTIVSKPGVGTEVNVEFII